MKDQEQKIWQSSLALSAFLHIVLILFFIFGMPSLFKSPKQDDPIVFEVLTVKDIANIKNASKSPPKKDELDKKSRKVEKSQIKSAPKPTPKKEVKEEKPTPKKEAIQPKKKQTPKPQKKQAAPPPKVTPPKSDDPMDSILKNLEQESKGTNAKTNVRSKVSQEAHDKYSKSSNYREDMPLSITEKLLIKNQIQKHWHELGTPNIQGMHIIFHVLVEKNGIITDVTIKDTICPTEQSVCSMVADSALRAIRKASPLEGLPPQNYEAWKDFELDFDPSLFSE